MLKQHLEDLVKEEHLKEFIESTGTKKNQRSLDRNEIKNVTDEGGPMGIINVVHGAINPAEMTTQYVKNQRRMAAHLKEVYQMSTESSIVNISGRRKAEISFSDDGLRDVIQPHNDALVLTLRA